MLQSEAVRISPKADSILVPAEVVLVAPSDAPRPWLPAWLGCRIPAVCASRCVVDGGPGAAGQGAEAVPDTDTLRSTAADDAAPRDAGNAMDGVQVASNAAIRPQARATARRDLDSAVLAGADGMVHLAAPPMAASDCLRLLEVGTQVREMHRDQGAQPLEMLPDDHVLRMIMFSSCEEAARRALLLHLLTWDPTYGALLAPMVVRLTRSERLGTTFAGCRPGVGAQPQKQSPMPACTCVTCFVACKHDRDVVQPVNGL
jgi:hypothetical protein